MTKRGGSVTMLSVMIVKTLRSIAVILLLLVPSLALGQAGQLGGTWKAAVLKKKDDSVSLTKDGSSLLITIDEKAKTWEATLSQAGKEKKSSGSYTIDDQHVVFAGEDGQKHTLRVSVAGNQMIISPKDEPSTRLIALRVK